MTLVLRPVSVQHYHMTGIADRHDTGRISMISATLAGQVCLTMIGSSSQDAGGYSSQGCSGFYMLKLRSC